MKRINNTKNSKVLWGLMDVINMISFRGYPTEDILLPFAFSPKFAFLENGFICQTIDPNIITIDQAKKTNQVAYTAWDENLLYKFINTNNFYMREVVGSFHYIITIVKDEYYKRFEVKNVAALYMYVRKYCHYDEKINYLEDKTLLNSNYNDFIINRTAEEVVDNYTISVLNKLNKIPEKNNLVVLGINNENM
jgi:hypothetical protein